MFTRNVPPVDAGQAAHWHAGIYMSIYGTAVWKTNDTTMVTIRRLVRWYQRQCEQHKLRRVCVWVCVIVTVRHVRPIDALFDCNITGEMDTSAQDFHQCVCVHVSIRLCVVAQTWGIDALCRVHDNCLSLSFALLPPLTISLYPVRWNLTV